MPLVRLAVIDLAHYSTVPMSFSYLDYGGCEGQDQNWCIPYVSPPCTMTLHSHCSLVTLLSAAIILAITTMEFFDFRRVNIDTSIVVDRSRGEKLTAKLNVTFPRVPCYREFMCPLSVLLPN